MTDAGYVFLGYGVTAAVVGAYSFRLLRRSRQLRREEQRWR